jgi:hypothetical protein
VFNTKFFSVNLPLSEELPPEPYTFIKSIAEQGYSLSTALADLIDNSVAAEASRVEILSNESNDVFRIFIADNGKGMSEHELHQNVRFPSSDPGVIRAGHDLGRFGLGMKTASFSQTRKFTVMSRKKGTTDYFARTWDVDYLKKTGKWSLIINSDDEISIFLEEYYQLSKEDYLKYDQTFLPNTIIIWSGMYKIERLRQDMSFKKKAFLEELNDEASEHIGLVFHRLLGSSSNKLSVRINNDMVTPFNPFPVESDVRKLVPYSKVQNGDFVSIQGYILPARSIKESKESNHSAWTSGKRSMTDMEGIYVYRNGRLIVYGGWNRLLRKSPQFQLGRLKVEIGNTLDEMFHLNVSKSSLKIPYEFRQVFLRAVSEIKKEAFREYKNRISNELIVKGTRQTDIPLLIRVDTPGGAELRLNSEFPLVEELLSCLAPEPKKIFQDLVRKINNRIQEVAGFDEDKSKNSIISEIDDELLDDIRFYIDLFKKRNYSEDELRVALYSLFDIEAVDEVLKK